MQRYQLFETTIGPCAIAWSEEGVTRFCLPEADERALERRMGDATKWPGPPPPKIARAIDALQRYFLGEPVDFSAIPLDLSACAPFHRAVYAAAREIPWGACATYGEIARRVGSPGAARAVGQALGRNPVTIMVPCHRVLAANGKMGGFSAHGGVSTKTRLLELEGARPHRSPTGADLFESVTH